MSPNTTLPMSCCIRARTEAARAKLESHLNVKASQLQALARVQYTIRKQWLNGSILRSIHSHIFSLVFVLRVKRTVPVLSPSKLSHPLHSTECCYSVPSCFTTNMPSGCVGINLLLSRCTYNNSNTLTFLATARARPAMPGGLSRICAAVYDVQSVGI